MLKPDPEFDKMRDNAFAVTADELRQFIERYEHLEAEKKDIADQQKGVMAEAKGRGYDKEYICNVYQSLVLRRVGELPPVAQAFVGWSMKAPKLGGAAAQLDLFARASVFFNPERREQTRIQINSSQGAIDHMRKIVGFAGLLKGR